MIPLSRFLVVLILPMLLLGAGCLSQQVEQSHTATNQIDNASKPVLLEIYTSKLPTSDNPSQHEPRYQGIATFLSGQLLVTNKHVVDDTELIYTAHRQGHLFEIVNIWFHPQYDLAVVKIDNKKSIDRPEIKILEGQSVASGQNVSMHTTVGQIVTTTTGYLLNKTHSSGRLSTWSTTLPGKPGNSGSPIFSGDYLVGVLTARDELTSHSIMQAVDQELFRSRAKD